MTACYRFWELNSQSNWTTMPLTRAIKRGQLTNTQRAERNMNQIIEANIVEIEATELQALAMQAADAVVELNASQLMLVGGGGGLILTD